MRYRQKIGKFGEALAEKYLIKKGYIILDKNLKISYQEIDLIAKLNQEIIFIEVKTRTGSSFGQADESLYDEKLENLKTAMDDLIYERKYDPEKVRLDLIAIDIDKTKKTAKIKHYRNII